MTATHTEPRTQTEGEGDFLEQALTETAPARKKSKLKRVPVLKTLAGPDLERTAAAEEEGALYGEWNPNAYQGSLLRTNDRLAKFGWYAPRTVGSPTTSRQAEILNTALIAPPTGVDGILNGRDVLSRTAVHLDPFTDYNASPRRVTSTNVLVVGDVGGGKSGLTKAVGTIKPLILKNRRTVVFDKKNEQGRGEYSAICDFFNGGHLQFSLGSASGVRMNMMDASLAGSSDEGTNNQLIYLAGVPPLLRGGKETTVMERKALRLAYHSVQERFEGVRTPTTADLHDALGRIDKTHPTLAGMRRRVLEELHEAGMEMRFVFNELLETYGGIFDGETSQDVKLHPKLTSFDISQLPDAGPAIPLVMGLTNIWLLANVRKHHGLLTNVINEEAGHILGGPMAQIQRSNIKLSRGLGIANWYNIHKMRTDVPAGTAGMAVIEEAQTCYVFRHNRIAEAEYTCAALGMNPESSSQLTKLRNGHCLVKTGDSTKPEFELEITRSELEKYLTDTDSALRERVDELIFGA